MSKVDCLIDLSYGDCGKGKMVDYLSKNYDIIARFCGGDNAGHTIYKDSEKIEKFNCAEKNGTLRYAAWSKLLSTYRALSMGYDYIVYIDSDCIFKDFNKTLDHYIDPHKDKNIIFLNSRPWYYDLPCTGFYICKVCDETKEMVKEWYNFDFTKVKNPCRWEQGYMWLMYKTLNVGIIDDIMFSESEGQYLRHVGTPEMSKRLSYFSEFVTRMNIPYEKNIEEIQKIEFDTYDLSQTF